MQEFIFSFLLSSRLFLHPHELLGKLISLVPESKSLESLVSFLAEWTKRFPYDFRNERIMDHVKHIVARYFLLVCTILSQILVKYRKLSWFVRCSSTQLEDTASELLNALLKRLIDLEHHEKDLRFSQNTSTNITFETNSTKKVLFYYYSSTTYQVNFLIFS